MRGGGGGGGGHVTAQLVEALNYKPESRGFDSRWCRWNFSLYIIYNFIFI